jgi:hypothetical protein
MTAARGAALDTGARQIRSADGQTGGSVRLLQMSGPVVAPVCLTRVGTSLLGTADWNWRAARSH